MNGKMIGALVALLLAAGIVAGLMAAEWTLSAFTGVAVLLAVLFWFAPAPPDRALKAFDLLGLRPSRSADDPLGGILVEMGRRLTRPRLVDRVVEFACRFVFCRMGRPRGVATHTKGVVFHHRDSSEPMPDDDVGLCCVDICRRDVANRAAWWGTKFRELLVAERLPVWLAVIVSIATLMAVLSD